MKNVKQLTFFTSILLLASCAQDPLHEEHIQENSVKTKTYEVAIAQERQRVHASQAMSKLASSDMPSVAMHRQSVQFQNEYIVNTEKYTELKENSIQIVSEQPVSTFSIDVDTASYANVRRILNQGNLPQYDAVRVEELINYFDYNYPKSSLTNTDNEQPFTVITEVAPSPFNANKKLIHIGIQGKTVEKADRPNSNLVFLVDVSGSMNRANKIGLLKNALKMLTKQLTAKDKVAIVVYAGAAGVVLKPTEGDNHQAINNALESLSTGGSTNGGAGIEAAYRLAQQSYTEEGINRVIIATDGDFNVGTVNQQALKNLIEQKRETGIGLSVLGFGQGNYNDALMQEIAQNGDGNAYYIDTLNEARKVLVEEISSTLMTIAKDVKIQVEFNPNVVSEYRLIGYETRALKREDFNNDNIDAGEIGAGHTVTALYEVSFVGDNNQANDPLRYQEANSNKYSENNAKVNSAQLNEEIAYLRLRYKLPTQDKSQLIESPILMSSIKSNLNNTSDDFRFSAAVAGYGQLLRGGKNLSSLTLEQVVELAQNAKGNDKYGYRGEFINMVKLTEAIAPN